jgi:molybdenum cofactor cytidylyltransferase
MRPDLIVTTLRDRRVTYRHQNAILKSERPSFDIRTTSGCHFRHANYTGVFTNTTSSSAVSRENVTSCHDKVTPVVLAGGAGLRFRDVGHKLSAALAEHHDRPRETVFARSLASVIEADIGRAIVVTGRLDAHDLGIADRNDLDVVHNHMWADGQMTSVRAGITSADDDGADIVVIGLADQPGIKPSSWREVADAALGGARIAVATYDGKRANPVALHRDVWDLLSTTGDEGARGLMRLRPDLVVEVPCTGSPKDIDTVEDLTRWQSN